MIKKPYLIQKLLICCFFTLASTSVQAQIIPDNTLSTEASKITPKVLIKGSLNDLISGGAQRGVNLFHSFTEFNIKDGQGVYFANPSGVTNILTRVTGVHSSKIFGTLGVNGRANLFLINPNGTLFGENALLDVRGSFVGTTANGVQFGNQGSFLATNPQAPGLLSVNPDALLFNQINESATIQNNSVAPVGVDPAGFDVFGLRVGNGKSLLLVGGDVSMDGGQLNAYGGRVELGGLASVGSVNLLFDGNNLRLGFPIDVTHASVSLKNQAFVSVEASGGGDIVINARNIDILGGSSLSAGIGEGLKAPLNIFAGDITLNATDNIVIDGGSEINNLVRLGSQGNGGNIFINSNSFSLQDGAILSTATSGIGNAGNVRVNTTGAVTMSDIIVFSTVEPGGVGKGGNIDINAATLTLQDSAQLQTATLSAFDGQPAGLGDAGSVNIKVIGSVDITGVKNAFSSAIFSDVGEGTVGNGGNITIDAASFKLRDGALLDARTRNNNRGGNITVNTGVFEALNGGQITTTTESFGRAGKITVNAGDKVIISSSDPNNNYRLTNFPDRIDNIGASSGFIVNSTGSGITGDIEINAPQITLDNQGRLQANSASGNGGNINLNSNLFLLRRSAQISTNAGAEEKGGDGGNISINSRFIIAVPTENSHISANAFSGKGGNVKISTQSLFGIEPRAIPSNQTSDITASSERGVQGEISIKQPDVKPAQGLIELPAQVIDVTNQIGQICPRGLAAKRYDSKFTITGRGNLPLSPLQMLPGTINNTKLATLDGDNIKNISNTHIVSNKLHSPIVEAQGLVRNTDGSMELVAMAPLTTPSARYLVATCPNISSM